MAASESSPPTENPASEILSNLSPEQRETARRIVLLTVFLDILGFGIIIPQLGIYAAQFGASAGMMSILASSFSAMQFLFAPFWGRLSDRAGRRPVLLYSIFGTALSYFLLAFANSVGWLLISRILSGITGGNIAAAQAYITDVTEPHERAKTFGIFGAIFGIGFAIGPLIGLLLGQLPGAWGGNLGIGVFTGLLSLLNWWLALKKLPETLTPRVRVQMRRAKTAQRDSGAHRNGFVRAFRVPGLGLLMAMSFIAMVAFATMQGTYPYFLIAHFARPTIQSQIQQNPQTAIKEARQLIAAHPTGNEKEIDLHAGETGATTLSKDATSASTLNGDEPPYAPELGGDWKLSQAPPSDLSWRKIEKTLVNDYAKSLTGWSFAAIGLVSLVVQGFLIAPLKRLTPEINLVCVGFIIMAAGLFLVAVPTIFSLELGVMALLAFGNGISAPVVTALVSSLAPENERGEIIGIYQSIQSLGRIAGPLIGGFLFQRVSPGAPYFTGGAIMLLAFLMSLALRSYCRKNPQPQEIKHES